MGNFKFDKELLQKLFAEFTGTAIVLTLGCSLGSEIGSVTYSLGWGLVYMTAIHIFAFMSGAHLNPAVSGAATIMGVMEWEAMLCYMLSQFLGALAGIGLAFAVSTEGENLCNPFSSSEGKVFAVELLSTIALVFAYCSAWDNRTDGAYETIALRIGFIIAALSFATSHYTGCSINFFREFASTLINNNWESLWPYFLAHVLGCCLTACLWRFLIAESKPEPME